MNVIRIAIIGCGRISGRHIQAVIDNADSISLVAVCDVLEAKAENKAEQYANAGLRKPHIYTDYKKMILNEDIEAIAIATESGFHAKIAIDCMNQGKHVIVEKPMALSVSDAKRMIEISKSNDVKLCIAHQNRFNPPIQKLRNALDEGRFGKIIAGTARILWNRNKEYYLQAPWRGTYKLDGGCLMNQCIHNIDLLQWLLGGNVKWINGIVGNYTHDYIEAEDYGSIQILFDNNIIGNVEGTVSIFPSNLEETIMIIGEKGTVSIGGLAVNKIETWSFADELDSEDDVKRECNGDVDSVYGSGHTPLYKDFIEAIQENRDPYISGEDGIIAVQIILAAYKSSKIGCRMNWKQDCSDLKSEDGGVQ